MRRDEAIRKLETAIPLLRRKGVIHAWLFGSVARDAAGRDSDIDVAIQVQDPDRLGLIQISSIRADLMDVFEVEVDVVPRDDIASDPQFEMGFLRDAVQVL